VAAGAETLGRVPAALAPSRQAVPSRIDLGWGQVVAGDRIGEGGMGVVHRGWLYYDPDGAFAGRAPVPVAIKALHAGLTRRKALREMFLGEAEVLKHLSHPNIVRFFGLCDAPGQPLALVMELVEGEPLSSIIVRHVARAKPGGLPALPFARAWYYFQQMLGALAATHELGIVHRDVKPANLLIRHDGIAKLTDYGIARWQGDVADSSGAMQPGTGAYMSPEQVLGRPLDRRSDVYSAAIVLYEMLSGRTPFDAPDLTEYMVRAAQVEAPVLPLTALVRQAPRVIDDLFAHALAKDPAARFPSVIELGTAFRHALGLPDSMGWQAQQELASSALGIAAAAGHRAKVGTIPVFPAQADQMRAKVAGAYVER
jgi:eukaryotic-like serine/threonine-protein kinase